MIDENSILERLAKLEHEQWAHWTLYFLKKHVKITSDIVCITSRQTETWLKLANTPYEKLSEKQKESDRVWARKVMEILEVDKK